MKKCLCSSADNTISLIRGTSGILEVDFNYDEDENLKTGIAVLGVKKNPKDEEYVIFLQEEYDMDKDCIVFKIDPAATEKLAAGTYYYDIGLQKDDDFYIIISKAIFNLRQNIVSREDVKTSE